MWKDERHDGQRNMTVFLNTRLKITHAACLGRRVIFSYTKSSSLMVRRCHGF
jgi:hypothetical protein